MSQYFHTNVSVVLLAFALTCLHVNATETSIKGQSSAHGLFVAIGYDNNAAYSYDGIEWNNATIPGPKELWKTVVYGNGTFVAIPEGGIYTKSPQPAYTNDGITWHRAKGWDKGNNWGPAAYGNGYFVTLSLEGTILYSADGIKWRKASVPSKKYWNSVAFGNGTFIAIACYPISSTVLCSSNGVQWREVTDNLPDEFRLGRILFNNAHFMIHSYDKVAISMDGTNWTISSSTPSRCNPIVFGNGLFVGMPELLNTKVATSLDGIHWRFTSTTLGNEQKWHLAYGKGVFVAVAYDPGGNACLDEGSGSTSSVYSLEGTIWEPSKNMPFPGMGCISVAYGEIR